MCMCLDAARECLHDVGLDAGHETEVEEDEAAVVLEHDIALVRVGVHEAGEHEGGGARLDRHACHAQALLCGQSREVRALHPFGDKDLCGRVLRHGLGRGDEAEEVERGLERQRVLRLSLVVELVQDVCGDAVDHRGDVAVVEAACPPLRLDDTKDQYEAKVVLR
jgi:hypothetical protein